MPDQFQIVSSFSPAGDQPDAIKKLSQGFQSGRKRQTLMGVTGSGKTFTMAHLVAKLNRPTLVLSHNKTLAAQLYREFRDIFPNNGVEYFVSYYDYYQPEAYVPSSDLFIEKDSSINEELDRLRLSATRSVLERRDVLIVSSVSCIYGIGSPKAYYDMGVFLDVGQTMDRQDLLHRLVDIRYQRNDTSFFRGTFRVRGDVVDIFRGYEDKKAIRVEFFGDEIEAISEIDPLRGTVMNRLSSTAIFPAAHYVSPRENVDRALTLIRDELADRLDHLRNEDRLVEAQRLEQRTRYDLEILKEVGSCPGIENYSRHIDGREAGQPAFTLLDYFPDDFLVIIDESHVTLPQLRAMHKADMTRKSNLIEHGFRLPSAIDNRPLRFEEFEERADQVLFVSATPGDFELEQSGGVIVEQLIRPTGLIEPEMLVRSAKNQVDDLLEEVRLRIEKKERVLCTTLTKRMSEDLAQYYSEVGVQVRYLHSDIDTIERTEIIRDLRAGVFDVLIGVNLLREGLDIPEVSLVAVLDADKEGFLRDRTSLIQTAGRASRNLNGKVIFYADRITRSMKAAMDEIDRRRKIQVAHNKKHGIVPRGVVKKVGDILETTEVEDSSRYQALPRVAEDALEYLSRKDIEKRLTEKRRAMADAAKKLEFERAAELRDEIAELEKRFLSL